MNGVCFNCYGKDSDSKPQLAANNDVLTNPPKPRDIKHANSWKNQLGALQSSVDYEMTEADYLNVCKKHWWAYIYERQENYTHDVEFMLSVFGNKAQNILEVCCGSGRILVPLAKAGHNVTGFDIDEYMLSMIALKAKDLPNIRYYKADALSDGWGEDFDIVVQAGNIMINIETDRDYKESQQTFIRKAAAALKIGGYLYLDFDLSLHPETVFNGTGDVYFEGYDDTGVYGKTVSCGGRYDPVTQMSGGLGHFELTLPNGEKHNIVWTGLKHIPTLRQIHDWLTEAGFVIEQEYGDYSGNPICETTHRAIIFARKNNH
jgi:SAM-dependent methyltransferase